MEVLYDVPLYSQSWKLDDWRRLGFKSRNEAEYWEKSSCGILCINEIASFLNKTIYSTAKLIELGQKLGGYSDRHGWEHKALVQLAIDLGLKAESRNLHIKDIRESLYDEKIPIISIKWAFETSKSLKERVLFWKKYGGHLAVVVGCNDGGFFVNHTSIKPEFNWRARFISNDRFKAGYTGRAVLVWK